MAEMREDNARDPEQIQRMREAAARGECYFCTSNYRKYGSAPAIYRGHYWFAKKNDYPYSGAIHHYLIIAERHIRSVGEMNTNEKVELWEAVSFVQRLIEVSGFSVVVRSGEMGLTSGSIDHLHFHIIVGERKDNAEPNKLEDLILAPVGYKKKN